MRILVVEDDPRLGAMLRQGLQEQQYAVDVAPDGDTADALVAANPYDVIILDIRLPGRDGLTLCREWRAAGSATPLLMLTAYDTAADTVCGLDTGADDYLTKPFDFEVLFARLRTLIRRGHARPAPKLQVADLELDPATQAVTRAGRPIALTALEFRLLRYLMENANRVLDRSEIGEHVWDRNFSPESNIIDVCVNHLRGKIDRGFTPPLLHTVRGAGYRLGVREA